MTKAKKYNHLQVEKKWQKFWETKKSFVAKDTVAGKQNMYILDMFPYPSGAGLHVGHPEGYTATDILTRYYRAKGFNVLHPMGWDAFGLPAENYAIKVGIHPETSTKKNIRRFTQQIKSLGFSYDWSRELSTCDPEYYKWTQWLFLKLYEKGLAYKKEAAVNWCPQDHTVLANEQVVNGKCERCGSEVVQKELSQWFFKITDYAERLLKDVESLDWPDPIKHMQKNWIGKSEGITYTQKVKGLDVTLTAYDSVPQTFMAQTFAVIAPEHPMLKKLVEGTEHEKVVLKFADKIKKKKLAQKFQVDKDIEGIFTGRFLDNPFGTGDLPIWVASFVVMDYGSGFVNCSAHDERDFAFAKKYGIPLRPVMFPKDPVEAKKVKNLEYCYHHATEGVLEKAPEGIIGMTWSEAREPILKYLEKNGYGKKSTQYKIRDWLVSRQRYWGAPIPIIHCEKCGEQPVPEKDLPVVLPKDVDFRPTGESPLTRSKKFHNVNCPKCKGKARRDSDTMDTFVDSSWYYLRYTDPNNKKTFADTKKIESWLPVNTYVGGAEHAVLHLLYSRFFTKFLFDQGLVKFEEPFLKLRNQGLILGPDGEKMSKSKGNVINPDDVVKEVGADSLRLYEMFMGPLEDAKPWSTQSISGVRRFLEKVWIWCSQEVPGPKVQKTSDSAEKELHKLIKKVTEDIEGLRLNTAISAFMQFLNNTKDEIFSKKDKIVFLQLLHPFAPHISEELHEHLGGRKSIQLLPWPSFDINKAVSDEVDIVVQINGKFRDKIRMSPNSTEAQVKLEVLKLEKIKSQLGNNEPKKIIFVQGRLINFVL